MCPGLNSTASLKGTADSKEEGSLLKIDLWPCYLRNRSDCVEKEIYSNSFSYYLMFFKSIIGQVFVFNTAFNPQNKDPLIRHIESNFMPFTEELGS